MVNKITGLLCLFGLLQLSAVAQHKGRFSVGLESNSAFYVKDSTAGAAEIKDKFASNNYLKLDYVNAGFSAGAQYEAYLPVAMQGFPEELKKSKIAYKYAAYKNSWLDARVGDFYEQFGSGLLFRAWEDRALGINNSLEGVDAAYTFRNVFTIRGVYGRPRYFFSYADSWLRGADLSFNLSTLAGWDETMLSLEGSFLNKRESLDQDWLGHLGVKPDVNGYSARVNFEKDGFTFKTEGVLKSSDAAPYNHYSLRTGKAILMELGYSVDRFGSMLSFRRMVGMDFRSTRDGKGLYDQVNYVPSLTQQHTYKLANLNPYQAQAEDEAGAQLDLFWKASKKTSLHFNGSMWYGEPGLYSEGKQELLFRELSADVTTTWSPSLKTIFLYSNQTYNPVAKGWAPDKWTSHIFVADALFKLNKRNFLRTELQYLYTESDRKSWVGGLIEYTIAPKYSFSVSDYWNYGSAKTHYYNASFSYSQSRFRGSLGYGRFMEGYQCSGGVCRFIPAYKGVNLSVSYTY